MIETYLRHTTLCLVVAIGVITYPADARGEGEAETSREIESATAFWTAAQGLYDKALQEGESAVRDFYDWAANEFERLDLLDESDRYWKDVQELYEKAYESGETTAANAYEWLKEDVKNIGDWEYKVERVSTLDPIALEERLDGLGKDRWNCFQVVATGEGVLLFMKRPKRSYVRLVPFWNLLKTLPSGDSAGPSSTD